MQRGFTLIETVIATSLLAVALVGLAQFVGAGVQIGLAARAHAASTQLAEQKMEQLRVLPWPVIAAMPARNTDYLNADGEERCAGAIAPCGDAMYARRWSASPAPFSRDVLIIEVAVQPVGKAHGHARLVTARGRMTP